MEVEVIDSPLETANTGAFLEGIDFEITLPWGL